MRNFAIFFAWVLFGLIGLAIYNWSSTPTTPFTGYWSGQSIVEYSKGPMTIKTQLIVDDAYGESARLIAQFEPKKSDDTVLFQSTVTTGINVLKRQNSTLTFSLSEMTYTHREALEKYIDRSLPIKGTVVTGQAWAITDDEIFIYLTLPFGEKMGVVLKRHE